MRKLFLAGAAALALSVAGCTESREAAVVDAASGTADYIAERLDRLNAFFSEKLAAADEAVQDSAVGTSYIADLWASACDRLGGEWRPETPECVVGD